MTATDPAAAEALAVGRQLERHAEAIAELVPLLPPSTPAAARQAFAAQLRELSEQLEAEPFNPPDPEAEP